MAFTEAERNNIATNVIGCSPVDLTAFLAYNAVNITPQVETDARTLLTTWDANNLDTDYTQLLANNANYGIQDDPENLRSAIREQMRLLLGIQDGALGSGSMRYLERA